MELYPENRALTDQRGKDAAVVSGPKHGSIRQRGRVVAVHMIEELGTSAEGGAEDRVTCPGVGQIHPGPAYMRHRQSAGEASYPSRQQSEATRVRCLLTRLEEKLEAEADAQQRSPSAGNLADSFAQTSCCKVARRETEVSDAGDQHPLRPPDLLRLPGKNRLVTTGTESPYYAGQVVDPIVYHGDHNAPLVEGTPLTRGSMEMAPSS